MTDKPSEATELVARPELTRFWFPSLELDARIWGPPMLNKNGQMRTPLPDFTFTKAPE